MRRKLPIIFTLGLLLTTSSAWALDVKDGDVWNGTTKTLTVNSNPGNTQYRNEQDIEHVVISSGVTSIGDDAFNDCGSLTTVIVYAPSCTLGELAFQGCENLSHIYVFEDRLDNYYSATNWKKYDSFISKIPNSGDCGATGHASDVKYVLTENSSGKTLTIMKVGATGAMADFDYNNRPWESDKDGIQYVVINEGVTTIGDNAFCYCSSLTSVSIPTSVTTIGDYAINWCKNLATVKFEDGSNLTTIGEGAFSACSNLTSVTIPSGVTAIGEYAFFNCSSLTAVTIPAGVTTIGDGVFQSCFNLTSVTIPDGVTTIGDGAFQSCSNLTSVTIPVGVTQIGDYAFGDCSNLETVTFVGDSQLESIGENAFWTTALTSFEIGSKVASIGDGALGYCKYLTSITVKAGNKCFQVVGGGLLSKDGTTFLAYPPARKNNSYDIPW